MIGTVNLHKKAEKLLIFYRIYGMIMSVSLCIFTEIIKTDVIEPKI